MDVQRLNNFFDNEKRLQLGVKRFQVVLGKRSENRLENLTTIPGGSIPSFPETAPEAQ